MIENVKKSFLLSEVIPNMSNIRNGHKPWKNSQNSQENTFVGISFLILLKNRLLATLSTKRLYDTGFFLWILCYASEQLL